MKKSTIPAIIIFFCLAIICLVRGVITMQVMNFPVTPIENAQKGDHVKVEVVKLLDCVDVTKPSKSSNTTYVYLAQTDDNNLIVMPLKEHQKDTFECPKVVEGKAVAVSDIRYEKVRPYLSNYDMNYTNLQIDEAKRYGVLFVLSGVCLAVAVAFVVMSIKRR